MIEQTLKGELLKMSETQASVEEELLAKPNVVGVALGNKVKGGKDTGKPALLVLVNQKLAPDLLAAGDKVPQKYADTTTDVMEVGNIFAGGGTLPPKEEEAATQEVVEPLVLRHRVRPAMGGFSVGHYKITAGTIATCCYRSVFYPGMPPAYYILSNNHVLANCNDANIGDPILQPGPYDGGFIPRDVIAHLSAFVPIQWVSTGTPPCNYVDAAIAEGQFYDLNREIYWIGYVKGYNFGPLVAGPGGTILRKTGRTTNFTSGRVQALNATVMVNYGGGRVAKFCNQILTGAMSAGGDSGSLVCDTEDRAVGLLFAGSISITVVSPIIYALSLLGIRLAE